MAFLRIVLWLALFSCPSSPWLLPPTSRVPCHCSGDVSRVDYAESDTDDALQRLQFGEVDFIMVMLR